MSRKSQVAAGVLVYRRRNGLQVLLGHPGGPFWAKRDEGVWSIPKGLVESDDLLACAKREFLEETNLPLKGQFIPLQPVRQKSGKTVHAFALEADLDLSRSRSNLYKQEWPPGSGKFKSFPEIDRIAYFDLPTARIKILPYQLPYLDELGAMLEARRAQ
jgi:predicted NUDIX family NTP pyrophosphohydrolase